MWNLYEQRLGRSRALGLANTRGRGRDLHWWQRGASCRATCEHRSATVGAPVARDRRDHRRTRSRDDWAVARERHRTSCQWPLVSPYWRPRTSPLVAIVSPHGWPSNLPTRGRRISSPGVGWGQVRGVTPLKGERDIWALWLGEDRQLRTRALEGHKRARGRPHEHDVGVFGFLRGA